MMRFIPRDSRRTEDDDFKLNVEDHLMEDREAVPQYELPPGVYIEGREVLVGWKLQYKYE